MRQSRPKYLSVAIIFGWIVAGSTSFGQEAELLQWKFNRGDMFDVTLIQNSKVSSQLDQRVKDVESILTLYMSWDVKSVDAENGHATIEQKITRVKLSMESQPIGVGKSIDIDTDSEETKKGIEAGLLKQVQPLVGATYDVTMSARGEILDVTVPESTLATLRSAPVSLRLRSLMSPTGMKEVFGQSVTVLPDTPPAANETWTEEKEIDTEVGNFVRQHTYSWTGNRSVNDTTFADIKLVTTLKPGKDNQKPDVRLVSFSGEGNLVMNVTDGYFVSSKTRNEMKTDKSYREKVISTTVNTIVEMQIKKK